MLRSVLLTLIGGSVLSGSPAGAQSLPASVPYVPTPMPVVSAMLALGQVRPGDVVYDLGSGDGRIVITAAQRFGTRGTGFEIDQRLIRRSRENAAAAGVDTLVRFVAHDLFTADLRGASVVMLYLSPIANLELRPKLLDELAPGSRVVSHTFHMGDWKPDSVVHVGEGFEQATVHLWVVPADVDGFWQLVMDAPGGERHFVLELAQRYQALGGAARGDAQEWPLLEGKVSGTGLSFVLADGGGEHGTTYRFTGRGVGSSLQGTYVSSAHERPLRWRATRFSR